MVIIIIIIISCFVTRHEESYIVDGFEYPSGQIIQFKRWH